MYEKYIKERANIDEIKTDKGFIHYGFTRDFCIIEDLYVLPEYRGSGHAYFLADQVLELCRQMDIKTVYCQTDDKANGVDFSKFVIENYGFELFDKSNSLNFYKMEVSEWARQ